MTFSFKSNDGTTWELDGSQGVTLLQGASGLYAPTINLSVDQRVGSDGGVVTSSRQPARPVDLPLRVSGTAPGVRALWAGLVRSFAAGGTITHTGVASTRQLRRLVLESVTDGALGWDLEAGGDELFTVSLLAMDPWWYGSPQAIPLLFGTTATPWNAAEVWSPALPWSGGAATAVDIEGDADATPYIDIVGPVSDMSVAVSSSATGRRVGWRSTYPLDAGQRLTVDHRWSSRGPRLAQSASVNWALLTPASRLFTLPRGRSNLIAGLAGTTSDTQATMYWEPRWLTP